MSTLDPNRYATPVEAALLREHSAVDEAALPALKQRISQAQSALHDARLALQSAQEVVHSAELICEDLAIHEYSLERRLARVRGLLHPLRRLPDELLSLVFCFWQDLCTWDYDDGDPIGNFQVPYYAASVCRRWRRVALRTHALWRFVKLDMDIILDSAIASRWYGYVDTHIARSGTVPMEVFVRGYAKPDACRIWHALSTAFERARTLYIGVQGPQIPHELRSCFHRPAPTLEDFDFNFDLGTLEPDDTTSLSFFPSAPLLQTFKCYEPPILWPSADAVYLCVTQVEIWTRSFDTGALLELFHHMPNIKKLVAYPAVLSVQDAPDGFSLQNDSLEVLELHAIGFEAAALQRIHFPSLRTAELEDVGCISAPDDLCYTDLLQHPFRTVEKLGLFLPVDGTLIAGLWSLDRLQELSFGNMGYANNAEDLFDALACPHAHGGWLCPRLRGLTIRRDIPRATLCTSILQMARARGPSAPPSERPPQTLQKIQLKHTYGTAVVSVQSANRFLEVQLQNIFGTE